MTIFTFLILWTVVGAVVMVFFARILKRRADDLRLYSASTESVRDYELHNRNRDSLDRYQEKKKRALKSKLVATVGEKIDNIARE